MDFSMNMCAIDCSVVGFTNDASIILIRLEVRILVVINFR